MSDNFWKKVSYYTGLLPFGAIFGVVFYLASIEIKDLDLWLHLGMGKFIAANHFVPSYDMLSCTIAGAPWVNHEWLFQVIVYNIFHLWGPDGLIKMQMAVVLLTMLFLLFLGYSKDKQLLVSSILFLVVMVYSQRFTIRPDIYSLLFFTFYIFVLALHIDKKWAAPALFVTQIIWTNMHGFFFFGPVFVFIGVISEWIKRNVPLPYEWNESGRLSDDEYKRLQWVFIMVAGACLINPCGLEGAVYPLKILFSLSGENKIFFKYIQELQKPVLWETIADSSRFAFYKLLIMISAVSFILNRRRIDISALFFWLVFLIFSLKAARNTSFFAFAAYLVIITNIMSISYEDVIPIRFTAPKFLYLTSAVVKLLFVAWLFQFGEEIAKRGYYDFDTYERKSEFWGVSQQNYSDKAVDFLAGNKIRGNFFNDFNTGAYLVGRVFPDIKVFIDGRTEVYGGDFFEAYRKIWEEGNSALFEEMVQKYHLTGALLSSAAQHIPAKFLNYLYKHPDWRLVYFDYDAVVFLRDTPQNKPVIDRFLIDFTKWSPSRLDLLKVGSSPIVPYRSYYRAFTLESLGLEDLALSETLDALKASPGYPSAHDLAGKIYAKRKEFSRAFEHFRLAVIGEPQDLKIRHNLALCYFDLGEYKGAIDQYQRIAAAWPDDPKAHFLLSKTYVKDKQYGPALKSLGQAHRLAPVDVQDVLGIGDMIYEQGNYEAAKNAYALALGTGREPALVHKKIGLALKEMGNRRAAAQEFEKSLGMNPEDEEIKTELGRYNAVFHR